MFFCIRSKAEKSVHKWKEDDKKLDKQLILFLKLSGETYSTMHRFLKKFISHVAYHQWLKLAQTNYYHLN